MVGDLGQFLGAAAGQAQDFDRGPGPERVVFFEAEVASLAGARVVCPDPRGRGPDEDGPGQGLPAGTPLASAGTPCLVETDALHLSASARSGGPLLIASGVFIGSRPPAWTLSVG